MTIKRLLVVGDVHAGSIFSPCPASFVLSTESVHRPNKVQRYVNKAWANMCESLPELDYLIFNGDMTDGPKPGKNGIPLYEHHPLFQARIAHEMCKPLQAKLNEGGRIYCVEGTEYHEGERSEASELFAMMIGAERAYSSHYAHDWLLLDVDGITLDIHHAQSYHTVYRTTPLMRELDHSLLRTAKFGEPPVYGVIRSHTHSEWYEVAEGLRKALAVPAWQCQTAYATKGKLPNRMVSQWIGSALVEVDAGKLKDNDAPVTFRRLLYAHPKKDRIRG